MTAITIGQLLLDKYGRLGIIISLQERVDGDEESVEIEWLVPRHGKMLMPTYKAEELRINYLAYRKWIKQV